MAPRQGPRQGNPHVFTPLSPRKTVWGGYRPVFRPRSILGTRATLRARSYSAPTKRMEFLTAQTVPNTGSDSFKLHPRGHLLLLMSGLTPGTTLEKRWRPYPGGGVFDSHPGTAPGKFCAWDHTLTAPGDRKLGSVPGIPTPGSRPCTFTLHSWCQTTVPEKSRGNHTGSSCGNRIPGG